MAGFCYCNQGNLIYCFIWFFGNKYKPGWFKQEQVYVLQFHGEFDRNGPRRIEIRFVFEVCGSNSLFSQFGLLIPCLWPSSSISLGTRVASHHECHTSWPGRGFLVKNQKWLDGPKSRVILYLFHHLCSALYTLSVTQ